VGYGVAALNCLAGAEEKTFQDRNMRSKVSGRPRAGDFFHPSKAAYVQFSDNIKIGIL
jgi:hypothetical protein